MAKSNFEWDEGKALANFSKHGVPFDLAQYAFADPKRVIAEDHAHSTKEKRHFCFGQVGAGYWRKGKAIYEHENQIHR